MATMFVDWSSRCHGNHSRLKTAKDDLFIPLKLVHTNPTNVSFGICRSLLDQCETPVAVCWINVNWPLLKEQKMDEHPGISDKIDAATKFGS